MSDKISRYELLETFVEETLEIYQADISKEPGVLTIMIDRGKTEFGPKDIEVHYSKIPPIAYKSGETKDLLAMFIPIMVRKQVMDNPHKECVMVAMTSMADSFKIPDKVKEMNLSHEEMAEYFHNHKEEFEKQDVFTLSVCDADTFCNFVYPVKNRKIITEEAKLDRFDLETESGKITGRIAKAISQYFREELAARKREENE